MATAQVTVKLSRHAQSGIFKCWKKTIGGRNFYLSRDRVQAERMAFALLAAWSNIRAAGGVWTDASVAGAYALAGVRPAAATAAATGLQDLYDAIDCYLADYRTRVTKSRYLRHAGALEAYKSQQPDVALRFITAEMLAGTVAHFRSRPRTAKGQPMAVATVQTTIKAVRALFDWLDLSGRWEAPRRFERLFRVNYRAIRTPDEIKRDGNGVETFAMNELVTLWRNATRRQRLYLGLGLNIGETAQGLADLHKSDFRRSDGMLVIDRNRGKTGVRGVYTLWPEVADLVGAELDTDEAEPLAFKTSDGNPLVWYHETGRVDSVSKTWGNLLKKCGTDVRRLGHRHLRKTGASLVEQLTGSVEVSQTYLSHTGKTVAERHYLAKRFSRLADALEAMRQHLSPVFAPPGRTASVLASKESIAAA